MQNLRPSATIAETWIAWFTFALLIVSILAALASYLQWDAARKALAFTEKSSREDGIVTRRTLSISDRVARATETQAINTQRNLVYTKRLAGANETVARTAVDDLKLKRSNDLDIGDEPHGLTSRGFATTFTVTAVGTLPIRNAQVTQFAGWSHPSLLNRIWGAMPSGTPFDILPGAPHTFTVVAALGPDRAPEFSVGDLIAVTAVSITFVDGNGVTQERRGCIYYTSPAAPQSCDNN